MNYFIGINYFQFTWTFYDKLLYSPKKKKKKCESNYFSKSYLSVIFFSIENDNTKKKNCILQKSNENLIIIFQYYK